MEPSPEAVRRHPHLGEPCPTGRVRVDMHSHTMWSGDSTTTPEELAAAIDESGVDVLCITDHQAVAGAQRLEGDLGCRVVVGEEVRTPHGEVIGLFLRDRIAPGAPAAVVAAQIRDQGGVVYIPHPFDPLRNNLAAAVLDEIVDAGLVDAIEVLNAKTSLRSLNEQAAAYARDHDLAAGAGSDAHVPGAVGAAYVEMPDFDGPHDFLVKLREGTVVGHHWDDPRPWSPRIVPSVAN